ncbi:alpha/beta hydrolase fold domain-containing protein [Chloroflexota bacterium]
MVGHSQSTPEPYPAPTPEPTPAPTPAPIPAPTPKSILESTLTTVEVTKDVGYGRVGDIPLLLDIYIPKTPIATPIPAIVFIRGGGWNGGDKGDERYVNNVEHLTTHRFIVASINYRLSGVATFPAAVEDSKCAVRWLRANAEEYNVNPQRIGVADGSSGEHLALMVGCVDKTAGPEGNGGWEEFSSQVQTVVSYYGHSDFFLYASKYAIEFIGGIAREIPDIYVLASPITHVNAGDPPLLLIHGKFDKTVPYN